MTHGCWWCTVMTVIIAYHETRRAVFCGFFWREKPFSLFSNYLFLVSYFISQRMFFGFPNDLSDLLSLIFWGKRNLPFSHSWLKRAPNTTKITQISSFSPPHNPATTHRVCWGGFQNVLCHSVRLVESLRSRFPLFSGNRSCDSFSPSQSSWTALPDAWLQEDQ